MATAFEMHVRFVDDREGNLQEQHKRRLQAIRARRYRRRRKENESTRTAVHNAEPVTETEQTEPLGWEQENRFLDGVPAGHEVHQSSDDDIEPGPCQQEEFLNSYSTDDSDHESEIEHQSPNWYVENERDFSQNAQTDLEYATEKVVQQFLAGIHGCGSKMHGEFLAAHIEAEGDNHHALDRLVPRCMPQTLNQPHFLPRPSHRQSHSETPRSSPSPSQWQELFSGSTVGRFGGKPKQACLHAERAEQTPPIFSFDVDSILGFVDSLAVAALGIRFYSAPQYCQNIDTDVHMTMDRATRDPERPRMMPSQLKDVPHFMFARIEGADFIALHLFFPHLPCRHNFHQLTDEQFSRWFDDIFYPAVRQVCDSDTLQHLPASYRHAVATCRAPQVEDRVVETSSYQSQLRMTYFLPPQCLHKLWEHILATVSTPGLQDFRDPQLFVDAKGTKLRFKSSDSPSDLLAVMENFDRELHRVLDFSYVNHDRLYVDVAKETCPPRRGPREPEGTNRLREGQVYLWRRCCLEHHLSQLYDGDIPKSNQNFYYESMLRDAGGMTTLTPSRSRLRRGGILYGQMYGLTKEIIDAARTFPFQNPDLRQLALDSRLRNGAQSICSKSKWVKSVTDRAYLASKRRCHYGLIDSRQRSFGVREEYRISWTLFQNVMLLLRSLGREDLTIKLPAPPPYLWVVRSAVFVDFVWSNINKFTTGFELIRASCSPGLIT